LISRKLQKKGAKGDPAASSYRTIELSNYRQGEPRKRRANAKL
jgi:hypothetical protein